MLVTLLRFINEQHGTAFVPGPHFPTDEHGAFAISETSGDSVRRNVLKWGQGTIVPEELRQAVIVTDRLFAVGYPVPRYRLVGVAQPLGVVYSVQEELSGAPPGGWPDQQLLNRLLELNALQRGRAVAPTDTWLRTVFETVLHGGVGFCLTVTEPPRSYARETMALLGVIQRLARADIEERSSNNDVVHFDFQGPNILVEGDKVSGAVDWEGCSSGDRAFDLATLYFYGCRSAKAAQSDRLWQQQLERCGERLLSVYLAHLILRQVDWSIRFHDRDSVE